MKKYILKYPIIKKGASPLLDVVIAEIEIRKPKAYDLMGLNFANEHINASMVFLISKLTGLDSDLVKEIDAYDYFKISNEVSAMMTGGTK